MKVLCSCPLVLFSITYILSVGYCLEVYHDGCHTDSNMQPLYLTPYLEEGRITEGQDAAKVTLNDTNVLSYAGFFTVNKSCDSNLFFWFFPAEQDSANAPVILWLQGGPGLSSMFGLFCENGPFYLDNDGSLRPRQYHWSKVFNVIYIDNPAGTGLSFTNTSSGYATDQIKVGEDLYSALTQFFKLFRHLRENDFYATGESFAGKYVPAIAHTIHLNNQRNLSKINLKGIAIGNGLTDPESMMIYGDYLYQLGIIDEKVRDIFKTKEQIIINNIIQKNFIEAYEEFHYLIAGDFDSFFHNVTGFSTHYNYLHSEDVGLFGDYKKYLRKDHVKMALHLGNKTLNEGDIVLKHLKRDFMQSVKSWVEALLEHYKVMFYSGQLDIICAYPMVVNYLKRFKWSGADEYRAAPRKQWLVDGELAGYSKAGGRLVEVLVRNAGHMVPTDQPKWALDMIIRFVHGPTF